MSHSVTITRTTTTSGTTSALIINTGYLKTVPGLLKLVQLLLGAACTGVMLWYMNHYVIRGSPELFFVLMAVTFMIATFCLLASCLASLSTGGIISKTIYELIYHTIGCILILAASLNLVIRIDDYKRTELYEPFLAASIMGLVNAILYGLLGAACTGVMLWYLNHYVSRESPELFFLLMVVTFMIATFCLLMSCLVSLSTGGIISKTIYLLGIVCTGIIAYYSNRSYILKATPELFFLLMVVTFMIATFCLLISCLVSLSTGGIISKTIYELVYHAIACVLILAASLTLLIEVNNYKYTSLYDAYMAASVIGLVNAVLYCISAIYAQRSYRGI